MWLLFVVSCVQPQRDNTKSTQTTTSTQKASGEALPVTASAYENEEPLATERIETVGLTDRFARRKFKDPKHADNWHELIIGTGNNSEKVYAYFHFLPLNDIGVAERDEREFRWLTLCVKYAYLANIPIEKLKGDLELGKECKASAPFFYMGLRNTSMTIPEGVDIRGIHLAVRRYKGKTGVIMGLSSDEWSDIRHAIMRGEKHELYSLFP